MRLNFCSISNNLGFQKQNNQDKDTIFNNSIEKLVDATTCWKEWDGIMNDNKLPKRGGHMGADLEGNTIQNFDERPILLGADVSTLYPSMDALGTAELAAKSVRETRVEFEGINYDILAVYIFLLLGSQVMSKIGLSRSIPRRKDTKN